jgi:hypothetical protein
MAFMNTKIYPLILVSPSTTPKSARRIGRLVAASLLLAAAGGGCGLLETTISLAVQTVSKDFGTSTATVPAVACTSATDPCAAAASQVAGPIAASGATVAGICDTAAMKCTAQVSATLSYPVNLSADQQYTSGVGGKAVNLVKSITLKYGVPVNSLTFNIPQLDLYIAPSGVTSITDPSALRIDKIPPIAKMTTSADGSGSIVVNTSTPAGQKFVYYVQHPSEPFVLLANTQPVLRAGDPMPAGKITVHIQPQSTVGL